MVIPQGILDLEKGPRWCQICVVATILSPTLALALALAQQALASAIIIATGRS